MNSTIAERKADPNRGTGRTTKLVEAAKAWAAEHPGCSVFYLCRTPRFASYLRRRHGDCGVRFESVDMDHRRLEGLLGLAFIDHDAREHLSFDMHATIRALNATGPTGGRRP